jgi:hypothetical protein
VLFLTIPSARRSANVPRTSDGAEPSGTAPSVRIPRSYPIANANTWIGPAVVVVGRVTDCTVLPAVSAADVVNR